MNQKKIIIIAGPNGAGKSTFAREFLPNEAACPAFINADLIAQGLSPFQPELAALRAGKIMQEEMDSQVERGGSFSFESTLSRQAYVPMIQSWQEQGYKVKIIYLHLASADQAIARISARVQQGGLYVPDEVVRRRFDDGFKNFMNVYRHQVDFWRWFDNSVDAPFVIDGKTTDDKNLQDADMQNAAPVLLRSAQRAKTLAEKTGTEFVVMRDGQLVREIPQAVSGR
jgi:predicted ABC-type ATPase